MKLLKNTDTKINKIIHVADIHIRLNKRHDEFLKVFNEFFNSIKSYDPADTIIAILGDVLHSKNDLQPECVELCNHFLKSCADLFPTILVAGNHDAILNNRSRMDSLTPSVNALNHPNLYYLKNTEIYRYENILFNNFSVFDDSDNYIKYSSIPSKYRHETDHHIALFHGPVDNAVTDIGYTVSNRSITNDLFDGHHIALLGDIHKHQVLSNKPIIVTEDELSKLNLSEWDIIEEIP
jgi:DNA repair exonuclease SbcCD nuclease subunit